MNPQCDECQSVAAAFWCESCDGGTNYCAKCDQSAHQGVRSSKHVRLTLAEKSKLPASLKCLKHQQNCQFYCSTCNLLVCQQCTGTCCKGHPTMNPGIHYENVIVDLKSCVQFDNVLGMSSIN